MNQEGSITKPEALEIYSYYDCFPNCAKLRPAVRLPSGVFALSHTRPKDGGSFIEIEACQVRSTHFKAKSKVVYLIKADSSAYRYNNVAGGTLTLKTQNEKKFVGLVPYNIQSKFSTHMQFLKIDFAQLKGATKETFGLSATSVLTPETAYALAERFATGGELSADEDKVTATDAWKVVFGNIQRAQLNAVLPNLPFPAATPEMVAAIPGEKLDEAIQFTQMVLNGNAADANDDAAVGVEGLTEYFGTADLTPYVAPAAPEDVVAALPVTDPLTPTAVVEALPVAEDETASLPTEPVPTPEAGPNPEPAADTANEDMPPADEAPAEVPAAPTGKVEVVPTQSNHFDFERVLKTREKMVVARKQMEESIEEIDDVIFNGARSMAKALDAVAALPEGKQEEAEDIVVSV
jgi:hypothetical protein